MESKDDTVREQILQKLREKEALEKRLDEVRKELIDLRQKLLYD